MATYDDPRILRAIAHPTRNRILAELHATASIRAADIARMLDIPANQASFHLRQLAKYGLIEEAPDEARDKRDRVWRLADAEGIRFRTQDMLDQPGGAAAWEVFRRNAVAWGHFLVDRALARSGTDDDTKSLSDSSLRLTKDEAGELMEELGAVVLRWRERTQGEDDDRSLYSIYQLVQPYPAPDGAEGPAEGEEA
jgi:DNA-binding transcriptional ArsR family regulator